MSDEPIILTEFGRGYLTGVGQMLVVLCLCYGVWRLLNG